MTKIDLYKDKNLKGKCLNIKKARDLARLCIGELNADMLETTIEVYLVTRETITRINHDFRQVSSETDVLSFPQNFLPKAKEKVLGTIFISPEVAKERKESCEKLFIHGIMHLLGFDHKKNLKKWQAAEKIITEKLKDLRTLKYFSFVF